MEAVRPSSGPVEGGTTVLCTGLVPPYVGHPVVHCKVGASYSRGTLLSSSAVMCITPSQVVPGILPIEVNFGESAWRHGSGLVHFEYRPSFARMLLFPTSGPVRGGSAVTVSGLGLVRLDEADAGAGLWACSFAGLTGRHTVRAESVSSTSVMCVAPSASADGPCTVEVSWNRLDCHIHTQCGCVWASRCAFAHCFWKALCAGVRADVSYWWPRPHPSSVRQLKCGIVQL